MTVAIYVKTESGDDYLYVMEGQPTGKEIREYVKNEMGDEYKYIADHMANANYDLTDFNLES